MTLDVRNVDAWVEGGMRWNPIKHKACKLRIQFIQGIFCIFKTSTILLLFFCNMPVFYGKKYRLLGIKHLALQSLYEFDIYREM